MDNDLQLNNEIYASLSHSGFPNYLISTHGKVFNHTLKKQLHGYVDSGDYRRVTLKSSDKSKCARTIHGLVGMTFLKSIEGHNMTINHIDRNKLNNNVNNLRWTTKS